MTRRQEIIAMLKIRRMTLREIADEFLTTQEEIALDLVQIRTGIRAQLSLEQTTPSCNSCGFVFKDRQDRNKVRRRTKCPTCHREDINPPRYFIEEHNQNIPKDERAG